MPERKKPIPIYFTSLELKNIRCFEDQKLDLTADGRRPARWTLILGDNGVGKTTLLQCLTWMRPLPRNPEPDQKPYNALLDEDDVILEHLLRQGSGSEFAMKAKLSIGSTLSSSSRCTKRKTRLGMPGETSVRIFFNDSGQLSQDQDPEPATKGLAPN